MHDYNKRDYNKIVVKQVFTMSLAKKIPAKSKILETSFKSSQK